MNHKGRLHRETRSQLRLRRLWKQPTALIYFSHRECNDDGYGDLDDGEDFADGVHVCTCSECGHEHARKK